MGPPLLVIGSFLVGFVGGELGVGEIEPTVYAEFFYGRTGGGFVAIVELVVLLICRSEYESGEIQLSADLLLEVVDPARIGVAV